MHSPIVVLKFGSSVLENHDALPAAVLEKPFEPYVTSKSGGSGGGTGVRR